MTINGFDIYVRQVTWRTRNSLYTIKLRTQRRTNWNLINQSYWFNYSVCMCVAEAQLHIIIWAKQQLFTVHFSPFIAIDRSRIDRNTRLGIYWRWICRSKHTFDIIKIKLWRCKKKLQYTIHLEKSFLFFQEEKNSFFFTAAHKKCHEVLRQEFAI